MENLCWSIIRSGESDDKNETHSNSFFSLERKAEARGSPRPFTNRFPPGDDHEDGDGEEVGEHPQDVRRDQGKLTGLKIKLKGVDHTEKERSKGSPQGVPQSKDHHGNGNPPLAGCHILFPSWSIGQGEIGSSKACHHATEDRPEITNSDDRNSSGIRSGWVLSHGPEVQARTAMVKKKPGGWNQEIAEVND